MVLETLKVIVGIMKIIIHIIAMLYACLSVKKADEERKKENLPSAIYYLLHAIAFLILISLL